MTLFFRFNISWTLIYYIFNENLLLMKQAKQKSFIFCYFVFFSSWLINAIAFAHVYIHCTNSVECSTATLYNIILCIGYIWCTLKQMYQWTPQFRNYMFNIYAGAVWWATSKVPIRISNEVWAIDAQNFLYSRNFSFALCAIPKRKQEE